MAVEFPLLKEHWGFPGGPMVKTLCFTLGGMGVIHGQGSSTCPEVCQKKKEKRKALSWDTEKEFCPQNICVIHNMCVCMWMCVYLC